MSSAAATDSATTATCPAVSVFAAFFVAASARHQQQQQHDDDVDALVRTWPLRGPDRHDDNVLDAGGADVDVPSYDFVVVGGGSAGCVLAARLSEVADWRVLLLEAGPPEPPEAQVPATYRNLQLTDLNWRYHSEPQAGHCNATGCPCPKGRVLGGSSTINGFVYIRGSPRDYDDWASALDDAGWSYASVLPFFLRSEDALEPDLSADREHHAAGGPLGVQRLPDLDPVNAHLARAMRDIGLRESDPNGASQLGYSKAQTTTRGGERASANRAFLEPARRRPNLEVRTGALVTRVLLRAGQAVGVEYRDDRGAVARALASREVLLSAGVMNSPQILMLSGIGPKEHLESLGIKVVLDQPEVGENLMNHVTCKGVEYLLPPGWRGAGANVSERVRDFEHFVPGGPLSSVGPEEITAFYKFDEEGAGAAGDDRPDINLRFYGLIPKSSEAGPGCSPAPVNDPLYYDRLIVTPVVLPTRSVGSVRLRSADPRAAPRIALNLLGDADGADLALLVRGLKLAASLGETAAFRDAGLVLDTTPLPGCEAHPFAGDAYWACAARVHTWNTFHTAGTCRMARTPRTPRPGGVLPAVALPKTPIAAVLGFGLGGATPAPPPAPGVLDPQLRVRGVSRLRVVDASAMPLLPRGNPNAPVIMLAERAAHLVRRAWGRA